MSSDLSPQPSTLQKKIDVTRPTSVAYKMQINYYTEAYHKEKLHHWKSKEDGFSKARYMKAC